MLTLTLHTSASLLREEHIQVGWRDYAYAVAIDIALITWIGWLVSVAVRWVLP